MSPFGHSKLPRNLSICINCFVNMAPGVFDLYLVMQHRNDWFLVPILSVYKFYYIKVYKYFTTLKSNFFLPFNGKAQNLHLKIKPRPTSNVNVSLCSMAS